jgi:hypothetical protein
MQWCNTVSLDSTCWFHEADATSHVPSAYTPTCSCSCCTGVARRQKWREISSAASPLVSARWGASICRTGARRRFASVSTRVGAHPRMHETHMHTHPPTLHQVALPLRGGL